MNFLKTLAVAAVSSLAIAAYAQPGAQNSPSPQGSAPDISGKYDCSGADANGKNNYDSPVTITKNGNTYEIEWLNSTGYSYNTGTGLFNPNVNNVLAAVFWDPKKDSAFGSIVYQVKPDGSLSGVWVMQSSNQIGTENCTKSK